MTYNITQHSKQRYAERIMNREELIDVNAFIIQHEDKIKTDINKMIEYGELIFEGIQYSDTKNNNKVRVYLKDTWIVIVDPVKMNVVTLYSIDLGVGDEFNNTYISMMLDKINEEKNKIAAAQDEIREQRVMYQGLIAENEGIINNYSSIIKSLKKQNEDYQELIKDMDNKKDVAETALRELVGRLIGKKSF